MSVCVFVEEVLFRIRRVLFSGGWYPRALVFFALQAQRAVPRRRDHCSTVTISYVAMIVGVSENLRKFSSPGINFAGVRVWYRADILDPALLRPGRLDRKIEIPLPNETSRLDIIKIHSAPITKRGEIDFESVVKVRHSVFYALSIPSVSRNAFLGSCLYYYPGDYVMIVGIQSG